MQLLCLLPVPGLIQESCFKYVVKHFPVKGHYVSPATGLRRVKLYDIQTALELVGKDDQTVLAIRQTPLIRQLAPFEDDVHVHCRVSLRNHHG